MSIRHEPEALTDREREAVTRELHRMIDAASDATLRVLYIIVVRLVK